MAVCQRRWRVADERGRRERLLYALFVRRPHENETEGEAPDAVRVKKYQSVDDRLAMAWNALEPLGSGEWASVDWDGYHECTQQVTTTCSDSHIIPSCVVRGLSESGAPLTVSSCLLREALLPLQQLDRA